MKTYEIKVTQDLHGWYNGVIKVEGKSPKDALERLLAMSLSEIDEQADWTHGDEYSGDVSSIEIDIYSAVEV